MATPKKPKPKPLPVTAENIGKAAKTNSMKALVALSEAVNRVALHGPFATELPLFCSVYIPSKAPNGFRRMNINIGTKFMPDKVFLGKKSGLIFSFTPTVAMQREGEAVERIEMGWDDVINHFGDLADKIEARLNQNRQEPVLVSAIDRQIKAVIGKNPSMHKILTEGFGLAQVQAKQDATDDSMEEIPGFGMF
jgi:hypothetical protein